ncbi:uncharacterized protein METZ01_LOCUS355421 [marine metagenome]|uniref:Uncharacterized protein n=1 Tax=marine metagenome TaxID=408172 RepID=A0A382RZX7_9ZZZZ
MPGLKFGDYICELQITALQQHQKVVEQIGGFRNDPASIRLHAGDNQFDSFFAEFLGNVRLAFLVQRCRVAFAGVSRGALPEDLFKFR